MHVSAATVYLQNPIREAQRVSTLGCCSKAMPSHPFTAPFPIRHGIGLKASHALESRPLALTSCRILSRTSIGTSGKTLLGNGEANDPTPAPIPKSLSGHENDHASLIHSWQQACDACATVPCF